MKKRDHAYMSPRLRFPRRCDIKTECVLLPTIDIKDAMRLAIVPKQNTQCRGAFVRRASGFLLCHSPTFDQFPNSSLRERQLLRPCLTIRLAAKIALLFRSGAKICGQLRPCFGLENSQ